MKYALRRHVIIAVASGVVLADATPSHAQTRERPDIFDSVAMPIDRTLFDDRWNATRSVGVSGAAARFANTVRTRDERARLEAVNAYVNARVAFRDDMRQSGLADRWSSANETLALGRGDCEDFALAKLAMLRRAGFDHRNLYLVLVKDLVRRADHAVLVVRSGGRYLVLDNVGDTVTDSNAVRDYRPVMSFAAGQRFVHGYRALAAGAPGRDIAAR